MNPVAFTFATAAFLLVIAVISALIADEGCRQARDYRHWPRLFVGFTLLFTAVTGLGWLAAIHNPLLAAVVFVAAFACSEWIIRPLPKRERA